MREKIREEKTMIFFVLFFTTLYVSLVFNRNVWTDEAFTIELIRENNFWGIIEGTAKDVHPPLYYLIVKIFVSVFGDQFFVYKLVSVIPMVLTMLLAFFYVKPWWGTNEAVTFIIMLNAIPCVMEYGVQIRMYSWALFFITWAGFSAYGLCVQKQKKYCIQLTIASICACYTHTYAMISCVCIYLCACIYALYVWVKNRNTDAWKHTIFFRCILSGSVTAVCYVPWLIVLYRQMTQRIGNYWIEPVTGKVILQYFSFLFSSNIPFSEIMYLILCMIAVVACIRKRALNALLFLAVPVMTAGIGIVVSILITPFFIARYLLPCMGLLAVFFAVAFQKKKYYVSMLIGFFGIFMAVSSYQTNYQAEYKSTQTEELLAFMEEHLDSNDLIAYNYEGYGFIYDLYFDDDKTVFLNDVDFAQDYDNIWYFDSCVTPWLDSGILTEYGLEKEFVMNTGIEQNAFHLYRIYHVAD